MVKTSHGERRRSRRPDQILARAQHPTANGRPVRKDEIELHDRGLYIESWLPERRSRRKPLLFVHGELAGSWLWERYLGYFAGRGWEGHALNLQNHHWSRTVDPTDALVRTYTEDVVAALERLGPSTVMVGHAMGGLLALKAAERMPIAGDGPALVGAAARPSPAGPLLRDPGGAGRLRQLGHRLGDAAREAAPRPARPDDRRRPAGPAHARPEAPRERRRPPPDAPGRAGRSATGCRRAEAGHRRRRWTARSRWSRRSGWRNGSGRSSSRSGPTRTTGWSSARTATSRSPSRSAASSRSTGCSPRTARRRDELTGPRTTRDPVGLRVSR